MLKQIFPLYFPCCFCQKRSGRKKCTSFPMPLCWFCEFLCVYERVGTCTLTFCTLQRSSLKIKAVIWTLPFSKNQCNHTSSTVTLSPLLFLYISRRTLTERNKMTDRRGDREWKLKYQKYERSILKLPRLHLPWFIYNIKQNNDTDKERWMTSFHLEGSDVFSRFSPLTQKCWWLKNKHFANIAIKMHKLYS